MLERVVGGFMFRKVAHGLKNTLATIHIIHRLKITMRQGLRDRVKSNGPIRIRIWNKLSRKDKLRPRNPSVGIVLLLI